MDFKILVKVIVPEVEKNYELYIPINKTVGYVCKMINKMLNETTSGIYPIKENCSLSNRFSCEIYAANVYIRDTNIRNGSQLVFY